MRYFQNIVLCFQSDVGDEHFKITSNNFPCSVCGKQVKNIGIFCNICNLWVHRDCNLLSKSDFKKLVDSDDTDTWSCLKCNSTIFPMNGSICNPPLEDYNEDENNHVQIMQDFFGTKNCKYYDIANFNSENFSNKWVSFLHLNITSIRKHFDNLEAFLYSLNHKFKIIGLTETRIFSSDIFFDLPNYNFFHTPTKSKAGGTCIFICKQLSAFRRHDYENFMYLDSQIESTFCEIHMKNQPNIIIGSIYKHPNLSITEFNNTHLAPLLDKASEERKILILLGDFNINLNNLGTDSHVESFMDILGSYSLSPLINIPTRLSNSSKTLIDNIFISTNPFKEIYSGNFTTCISDHLIQFAIINTTSELPPKKIDDTYYKDWRNFDHANFINAIEEVDWEVHLRPEEKNPNISFQLFYDKLTSLMNTYVPKKKLSPKQLKNNKKPWVTKGIIKAMIIRDKLFKKFINAKDKSRKIILHSEYKNYRNRIVGLIRQSEDNYYKKNLL